MIQPSGTVLLELPYALATLMEKASLLPRDTSFRERPYAIGLSQSSRSHSHSQSFCCSPCKASTIKDLFCSVYKD